MTGIPLSKRKSCFMPRGQKSSIRLPAQDRFKTPRDYYATALHELGHWTGHPDRLARDLSNPFGSEGYAREELRAEIASLILGAELGIGYDPDRHAGYVDHWVQILTDTPKEILYAAADAERISEYILTIERKKEIRHTQEVGTMKKDIPHAERTYLAVPYAERHEAKALGARWDAVKKAWYVGSEAPERCLKISTAILSACRCLSNDEISNSIRAIAAINPPSTTGGSLLGLAGNASGAAAGAAGSPDAPAPAAVLLRYCLDHLRNDQMLTPSSLARSFANTPPVCNRCTAATLKFSSTFFRALLLAIG